MGKVYLIFFLSISFISIYSLDCIAKTDLLNSSDKTKELNETLSVKARSGQMIFNGKGLCWACHGLDADNHTKIDPRVLSLNPKPTDLRNPNAMRYKKDKKIFFVIKNGIPNTAMVAAVKQSHQFRDLVHNWLSPRNSGFRSFN